MSNYVKIIKFRKKLVIKNVTKMYLTEIMPPSVTIKKLIGKHVPEDPQPLRLMGGKAGNH